MVGSSGLHHISKRKRVFKKLEEYPSKKFWIRFLDRVIVLIAIIGPLTALPQVWSAYSTKNVLGLSLLSWSSWAFFDLFWIFYGIVHKDKPIVLAYIIWFLMNFSVVIAILLYS